MTMAVSTSPVRARMTRLCLAALAAMVANTVIALIARVFDEQGIGVGLAPAEYLSLTLIGIVVGTLGWLTIHRVAPQALRVVVPVALVLSWIPDLLLFGSGATVANVVGLMVMHVVVTAAVVVPFRAERPARRAAGEM
ncbi:DUF6069 family protein [Amycolatopsis sp. cg5]|uniref:DUF6069 family protein n=1 Tax=Amycolatopsis sp. cg5 TaxID=3238802 RepID=UPI0035246502